MLDKLVPFIVLIGVLIFIHEMGHFLFAKLFDVKVLKFSLGFGPRLLGFRKGETEYCISAFPLGGYVKMLGEDPTEEVSPRDRGRAFGDKKLFQRFLIVFGGPLFNLLLPILIYFIYFVSQATLDPSSIGSVIQGTPAWDAGLRPGDRVVAIDGKATLYWEQVQETIAKRPAQEMRLSIERGPEKKRLELSLTPRAVTVPNRLGFTETVGQIGVTANYQGTRVGVADPESPAARAGLRTFDEIVAVDGKRVEKWTDLEALLLGGGRPTQVAPSAAAADEPRPLELTVLRPVDARAGFANLVRMRPHTVTFTPEPPGGAAAGLLGSLAEGLEAASTALAGALAGRVAQASGAGDVFAHAGRVAEAAGVGAALELARSSLPGVRPLLEQLRAAAQRVGRAGSANLWRRAAGSVARGLARMEEAVRLELAWPVLHALSRNLLRHGFHGVEPAELFVHDVRPGTPAEAMGLRAGDRVVSLNGQGLTLWGEIDQVRRQMPSAELSLAFVQGGALLERRFRQDKKLIVDEFKNEVEQYVFGARGLASRTMDERVRNESRISRALTRSVVQTGEVIAMTALGIAQLIQGKVSFKNVGGPVMIFDIAGKAAKRGWESFLWMMALISVNLGLLNLLPIPVLDGGHIVFIAIEAIKRKPVSMRAREIAGLVGFSLLILLMLFALKNDIERYWQDIVNAFR